MHLMLAFTVIYGYIRGYKLTTGAKHIDIQASKHIIQFEKKNKNKEAKIKFEKEPI